MTSSHEDLIRQAATVAKEADEAIMVLEAFTDSIEQVPNQRIRERMVDQLSMVGEEVSGKLRRVFLYDNGKCWIAAKPNGHGFCELSAVKMPRNERDAWSQSRTLVRKVGGVLLPSQEFFAVLEALGKGIIQKEVPVTGDTDVRMLLYEFAERKFKEKLAGMKFEDSRPEEDEDDPISDALSELDEYMKELIGFWQASHVLAC